VISFNIVGAAICLINASSMAIGFLRPGELADQRFALELFVMFLPLTLVFAGNLGCKGVRSVWLPMGLVDARFRKFPMKARGVGSWGSLGNIVHLNGEGLAL
ncbi:unnamed protein product, partial [Acidithrix sp. C25]